MIPLTPRDFQKILFVILYREEMLHGKQNIRIVVELLVLFIVKLVLYFAFCVFGILIIELMPVTQQRNVQRNVSFDLQWDGIIRINLDYHCNT